jgi:hypothetical protein
MTKSSFRFLLPVLAAGSLLTFTATAARADTPTETTTEFPAASDTSLTDIEAALAETPAGAAILAGTTSAHHPEANRKQLPTTGFPSGEVAAAAVALIVIGGLVVRRSRHELAAA